MGARESGKEDSTNTGGIDEGEERSFLVGGRVCADGTAARREGVERLTSRQSDEEDSGHTAPNSSQWPSPFIDAVAFNGCTVKDAEKKISTR